MKGLLRKDFYLVRHNIILGSMMILFLGIALVFVLRRIGQVQKIIPTIFTLISIVIGGMLEISISKLDRAIQWDKLANTMPLTQNEIIGEKYIAYSLFCLVGAVVGLIVSTAFALFSDGEWVSLFLRSFLLGMSISFFAGSLLLPGSLLLSLEKGDLIFLGSYLIACAALFGLIRLFDRFLPYSDHMLLFGGIVCGLSLLCYVVSYLATAKTYRVKDHA